jgi:hypothetical protein
MHQCQYQHHQYLFHGQHHRLLQRLLPRQLRWDSRTQSLCKPLVMHLVHRDHHHLALLHHHRYLHQQHLHLHHQQYLLRVHRQVGHLHSLNHLVVRAWTQVCIRCQMEDLEVLEGLRRNLDCRLTIGGGSFKRKASCLLLGNSSAVRSDTELEGAVAFPLICKAYHDDWNRFNSGHDRGRHHHGIRAEGGRQHVWYACAKVMFQPQRIRSLKW